MFRRILVATDLSAVTRVSLRAAFDLARHAQGEVLLVHVIRRFAGSMEPAMADVYEQLKARAKEEMLQLTTWFRRERGVDIACEIAFGNPASEIARLARLRGADLVVLAHTRDEAPGAVSYRVMHLAPCAVLVLKEPQARGARAKASRPRKKVVKRRRTA